MSAGWVTFFASLALVAVAAWVAATVVFVLS
jgi:hypothetical protein